MALGGVHYNTSCPLGDFMISFIISDKRLFPNSTKFDLLWIFLCATCGTTICATNQQQVVTKYVSEITF